MIAKEDHDGEEEEQEQEVVLNKSHSRTSGTEIKINFFHSLTIELVS